MAWFLVQHRDNFTFFTFIWKSETVLLHTQIKIIQVYGPFNFSKAVIASLYSPALFLHHCHRNTTAICCSINFKGKWQTFSPLPLIHTANSIIYYFLCLNTVFPSSLMLAIHNKHNYAQATVITSN